MAMKRVELGPEEQVKQPAEPKPAAPARPRRSAAKAAEKPAESKKDEAKPVEKPVEQQPAAGSEPLQGSAPRPEVTIAARSGDTLTGADAVRPTTAPAPKVVDVRLERSTPFEAILVTRTDDACTVAVPLRHLVVSAPPIASFFTVVGGKKLTGCFTASHELCVNPDTGAPSIIVAVANLTFDEGFRLPSDPRELPVTFSDGIEVRATWIERDPVLKLLFPLGNWHTTQRGDVQIRGRDSVDSRISQFRLRTAADGTPEALIVFRPLRAFCHKCKSELRDSDGVCPHCPQQPAAPVSAAPAAFNPFAVPQAQAPAAVVIAKPPVVTPPAPVVAQPAPAAVVVPAADLPYAPPGATTQTATASPAPPPSTPPAAPTEAVVICKYTDCNTPRRLLTDKSCRKCGALYPCAGCDAPRKLPTDKSCRKCGKAFPS